MKEEGQAAKLKQDTTNVMDKILAEKLPTYKYGVDVSVSGIKNKGAQIWGMTITKLKKQKN